MAQIPWGLISAHLLSTPEKTLKLWEEAHSRILYLVNLLFCSVLSFIHNGAFSGGGGT